MTESRVETLLRQISLAEPSTEIDERVAAIFRTSRIPTEQNISRIRIWGLIAATAVACLLLGVAVGRATTAPQRSLSAGSSEPLKPNTPEVVVVGMGEADTVGFESLLRAPEVTILCAMAEHDAGNGRKQCVDCHAGLSAAESRFAAEHVKHPSFATCMFCHDRTETTDGVADDHRRSF